MLNSKKEKDFIYELYRACRLCGGGAGYKMPIIQNIIDFEEADVNLKQKIRECVQIEVHQDDKMPPLICELCVDKINDFYEFLNMCRQTNIRTRLRLGLPPPSLSRGNADAGDCILGLTEPVFVSKNTESESSTKQKKILKVKVKKEPVVKLKIENIEDERASRQRKRDPTPPRITRNRTKEDDVPLISLQSTKDDKDHRIKPIKTEPVLKSALKKETSSKKDEKTSEQNHRSKRTLDKLPSKSGAPSKKVKIIIKPLPSPTLKSSPKPLTRTLRRTSSHQPSPRQSSPSPVSKPRLTRAQASLPEKTQQTPEARRSPSPPKLTHDCDVCGQSFKKVQARSNHMKIHAVTFTNPILACNPCGLWFNTTDEVAAHHSKHKRQGKPYSCRRCYNNFKQLSAYDEHFQEECITSDEIPDVKCEVCWRLYPTVNLLKSHKCLGVDNRPGGKCLKCNRGYALLKNLRNHEKICKAKRRVESMIDEKLLDQLKPIQIRVARCDPLLVNLKHNGYDVSNVAYDYGLDRNCYYPYISRLGIKSKFTGMVDIDDDIKKVFCSEDYVHWDSTDESDSDDDISVIPKKKGVDSLAALSLKTIFSNRLIGKVPRKKRKVKIDKVFDSLLVDDDDDRIDIGNIIDNLDVDDSKDDRLFSKDDSVEHDNIVHKPSNQVNNIKEINSNNDTNNTQFNRSNDKLNAEFSNNINDIKDNLIEHKDSNLELKPCDDLSNRKDDSKDLNNDSKETSILEHDSPSTNDKLMKINENDNNLSLIKKDVKNNDYDGQKTNLNNKFAVSNILGNNDANDISDLEEVINDTVKTKIGLGLNDFSFDFN